MTVLCYLKRGSHSKLISTNNHREHKQTGLSVGSDGTGYYVVLHPDLYQEPDFALREDLECDIAIFSSKIAVDIPVFTGSNIQTGSYDCDDHEVSLVVSREIKNYDGVLHRMMTIIAPTWNKLKATIAKIRRGEITPVGREQTVLERLTEELSDTRKNLRRTQEMLQETQNMVNDLRPKEAYFRGLCNKIYVRLFGHPALHHFCTGGITENAIFTAIDHGKWAIREELYVRATWWYRLVRFFSGTDNVTPHNN